MAHSLNVRVFWVITDIIGIWFLRFIFGAKYLKTIKCNKLGTNTRIYSAPNLLPKWAGALTLGRNIFIRPPWEEDTTTLRHELRHVYQGEQYGFMMSFLYFWDFISGFIVELLQGRDIKTAYMNSYYHIRFEHEAYSIQDEDWISCQELI